MLKNNTSKSIEYAFRSAYECLFAREPAEIDQALVYINGIRGLGKPSFASKHLRFIAPSLCLVYDAILTDKLPYAFTPRGYKEFAQDCASIASSVNNARITNPQRSDGSWKVADVESAIFARFYNSFNHKFGAASSPARVGRD